MGAEGEFRRKLARWVLDEDDLGSDDPKRVPSQQSVKAYVDGGFLSNQLAAAKLYVGDVSGDAAAVAISGDGTISSSGSFALAADASGFACVVDEDDMASDDDTLLPTQQSVKAYVDAEVAKGKRQYIESTLAGTISAAGSSYLRIGYQIGGSTIGYPMIRDGSVTGIVGFAQITSYVSTGTVTFEVRVNDTLVLSCNVSVTADGIANATPVTQAAGVDTFSAGDKIQTRVTTTGSFVTRPLMAFEIEYD